MKAKHKPPAATAPPRAIVNTALLTTPHHSLPVASQPTALPLPTTVRVIPAGTTAQSSTTAGTRLVNLPQSLLRQTAYVTTQGSTAPQGNIIRVSMPKSSGGVAGTRSILLPSGLLGNAVVRMQQPGSTLRMQHVRMPVRGQSVYRGAGVSQNVIYTTNVLPGGAVQAVAANRYVVPAGGAMVSAGHKVFPSGSIGLVNSRIRSNSPAPLVYGGPDGQSLGNGIIKIKLSDRDVSRLWVNEDLKLRKPNAFNVSVFYFWLLRPFVFSVL